MIKIFSKQVIVKEPFLHDTTSNLKEETQIIGLLSDTSSAHIVEILSDVPEDPDADESCGG